MSAPTLRSEPQALARSSLRVLAIEDNYGDAILVREMLAEAHPAGFTFVHATDIESGIGHLIVHGTDCVLLDLSLPDGDGLEALARVRAVAMDVPIIVISGRSDEALAVRAVQDGAQDYLVKGHVDPHLLARSINYSIERKRVENELAHQAMHDALTGLPNRALFLDRLGQALTRLGRHSSTLAVLFCDLDRFKVINDSLGHDAGDQLLIAVAARIGDALRAGDSAARFGGDEFVVLCEDIHGPGEAVAVASRVAEALAAPFALGDEEVFVHTSIGIALATDPAHLPAALVRDADAAMYRAKERGGSAHEVFDDGMRRSAVRRMETEHALHRALERGEFTVHFQRQVDMRTGGAHGVEALVRWEHPERGLVFPDEFIGAAEDTGLIIRLGERVFETACRQWVAWQDRGIDVEMSVNLSARQCAHPELVNTLGRVLGETGANPARLCLEVTETAVMADGDAALGTLEELKRLGVTLAIDDFGTGYSSLQALQRFPFDVVKIDRSFVCGVVHNPQEAAIVRAVIDLSHALGLRTTAEGVETGDQARRLTDFGCDVAQGFLYARPVPAASMFAAAG